MEGGLLGSGRDFGRWRYRIFHREGHPNGVRGVHRAGWSWMVAGRHAEFEKESCGNLSERRHILEDLVYKSEEFYSFCR